jgi:predicted  nucleic acid-binding Zn-ribbon protein
VTGFDAGGVVEPLHCKLAPYADFEGDIPEPSSEKIQAFMNDQRRELDALRKRIEGTSGDEDDLETELKKLTPAQVKKNRRRSAEIYSAVCSGTPSADQLEQLPHRVFAAFANWVTEEFLNPEAVTGAGNAQG